MDVTALLPADASSEGFDNIAEALGVSPSLIQGYVSAAMKISRRAVGDRTLTPSQITYAAPGGAVAGSSHRGPAARHARRHAGPPHVSRSTPSTSSASPAAVGGGGSRRRDIDVTLDGDKLAVPESAQLPHQGHGRAAHDRRGRSWIAARSAGVDEQYLGLPNQLGVHCRRRRADAS